MGGTLVVGKSRDIKAEPAVDKNQKNYVKINADGISGGLYENERKTEDRHPDYTGPMSVDGKKYRVSAWKKQIKTGQNAGQDFFSLAISEAREKPAEVGESATA